MYSNFEPDKLEEYLPHFIDGIDDILISWCSKEATSTLMQEHQLCADDMVNVIGIRILSYTFDIIEQTESLKFCPYAEQLVEYFDEKGLKINEIFLIYMDLSSVVREFLFQRIIADKEQTNVILDNFSTIFEYNLSDVLAIYFNLQLDKIIQEKENVLHEKKLLDDYKKIVDSINGIVVTDLDGFITYVNDQFCTYSGYRRESLIGRTFRALRNPNTPKEFYTNLWKTISSKKRFNAVVCNRKKDGSLYYVDSTISPILGKKGEITEYIALQRDITKEVEHDQLLRDMQAKEENSRLEQIQSSKISELLAMIPLAAGILNKENVIIEYNDKLESIIDPFDQAELLNELQSMQLSVLKLLTKESQMRFDSFPKLWSDIYNELYSDEPLILECLGGLNGSLYALRLSKIDSDELLICLEAVPQGI